MTESGFTRKKVASLTLGEKLQKFRTGHRKSLADVSRSIKIQVKYLEALESGSYAGLPADVYVRGFLRSYARYLGCDEEAILRMYERERNIQLSLKKKSSATNESLHIRWPSFIVTAKTVWTACIVLALSGVVLYLFREYHTFVSAPRLVILEPRDQGVVSEADIVVRGEADHGARVLINGQPALVDAQGNFMEKLLLQPGLNTIVVSAANRFGKERTETITIEAMFSPEQAMYDETVVMSEENHGVRVTISAPEKAVFVTVFADDVKVWNGQMAIGERKEFSADRNILVSSDNGKATYVEVGSESPRALSSEEQAVKDVLFAPER
jgi:transcriptional regulator with XRE-family HTH domain